MPSLAIIGALAHQATAKSLAWTIAFAAAKATGMLLLIVLVGRLFLRPLYRTIASVRSPELFAAATLLVILGTAWATAKAGLSLALGAFLAGLLIAGTEYRHQIEADLKPVRGLLLALFFVSVGMLIDLQIVVSHLASIVASTAVLIGLKAAIIALLCRGFSLPGGLAANAGLHLAQGGEFGFVLLSTAMTAGVMTESLVQPLIAVVALSMAATPLLANAGGWLQARLGDQPQAEEYLISAEAAGLSGHVLVAGFGRVGRTIGKMLDRAGKRWIAFDWDAGVVAAARKGGLPVFFGDAGSVSVLGPPAFIKLVQWLSLRTTQGLLLL